MSEEETQAEATETEASEAPAAEKAAAPAAKAAPVGTKKERKALRRSTHSGPVGKQRTPEERQAERQAIRKKKAAERRPRRAKEKENRVAGTPTPPAENASGSQKTRQGVVISSKSSKTITVRIEIARRHRRYEKIVRHGITLHVHDEREDANEGDIVKIVETRPMSRLKRWRLVEVVERAR